MSSIGSQSAGHLNREWVTMLCKGLRKGISHGYRKKTNPFRGAGTADTVFLLGGARRRGAIARYRARLRGYFQIRAAADANRPRGIDSREWRVHRSRQRERLGTQVSHPGAPFVLSCLGCRRTCDSFRSLDAARELERPASRVLALAPSGERCRTAGWRRPSTRDMPSAVPIPVIRAIGTMEHGQCREANSTTDS